MGMTLSRSATYLRLQPRRSNSKQGKRHVQTVPVKLLRPENTLRKKNVDRMFAKSFIDDLHEICKLFGSATVLFLSNDDKARVPLGLAAASLQAPLLVHLEYKVKLPDHSFVVAQRHKLIPSVYGVCEVTLREICRILETHSLGSEVENMTVLILILMLTTCESFSNAKRSTENLSCFSQLMAPLTKPHGFLRP